MNFQLPPNLENRKNEIRTAGFELEFTGLELEDSVRVITELFGGTHRIINQFVHRVVDSTYGDFTVEVDSAILKDKMYEKFLQSKGIDLTSLPFKNKLEEILIRIASTIVPYEIVTPPLAFTELNRIEQLTTSLRKHKAIGTGGSFVYAFGLHINIEVSNTDHRDLLNFLRSFLLLYNWIHIESEIDFTRRMTSFINEFPDDYTRKILSPAYQSGLGQLIDDYLDYNPTRNRPLDMLPIFAGLYPEKVDNAVPQEEIIKARPAFHYRLPNCRIDEPDWTIAREWNYWVEVEKLADNPRKILDLSREYLSTVKSNRDKKEWANRVQQWIEK